MRLLLKSNVSAHQGLPREYDLDETNLEVKNTFIFTESDIEGFKNKNKLRKDAADQNIPSYLLRAKVEKPAQQNSRGGRGRRGRDTFRQVIPSMFLSPWDITYTSQALEQRTSLIAWQKKPPFMVASHRKST